MPSAVLSVRPFLPGTTGWTASDLDDPAIERAWVRGSYEIVDAHERTLECFRLKGPTYQLNAKGKGDQTIKRSAFSGLATPRREVWEG